MVSRVSTERMRIRKIRINPSATRDLAEKHVLKLVEGLPVAPVTQKQKGLSWVELKGLCHDKAQV